MNTEAEVRERERGRKQAFDPKDRTRSYELRNAGDLQKLEKTRKKILP